MAETVIPIITATQGMIQIRTDSEINPKCLNEALLTLPAGTYLGLFREMHMNIYGYPMVTNWGGCCSSVEEKPELKAKIDYSEVDEVMEKVEEANQVAEKLSDLIKELQHKHVPIYVDVVEKKDK